MHVNIFLSFYYGLKNDKCNINYGLTVPGKSAELAMEEPISAPDHETVRLGDQLRVVIYTFEVSLFSDG